ncbi:MAG: HAMP domain-containing histidine kinase [Oligoflexia bacterium]|nr:HAMP domain-containing histidine kinase [Oligoflexia bacterium]MBF0364205.1 HAMP domain-containing histidine kinase [Oligoflexia bacterium]
MIDNENKNLGDSRIKTDESLKDEREKTDEIINKASDAIESETEMKTTLSRVVGDEAIESGRKKVDISREGRQSETSNKDLIYERQQSDSARELERQEEDRIHKKERFQMRLMATAIFDKQRIKTDKNLLDERSLVDFAQETTLSLLSSEKEFHDLTKSELTTREHFIAVLSHDLKNPLSSIFLGVNLMQMELSNRTVDVTTLFELLKVIELNTANMDRMINDLLDVERIARDKFFLKTEMNNIGDLLKECVNLFAPVILSRSFLMTINKCPDSVFAEVDHDKIIQVLSNLIGNALKFSPDGSTITLSARKTNNYVEISVIDNGPGIPDEKKTQIFEKFSQVKMNDRSGLGLGLFISKWIVEAHQGQIWVTSELGKGSIFSFTLPLKGTQGT